MKVPSVPVTVRVGGVRRLVKAIREAEKQYTRLRTALRRCDQAMRALKVRVSP